MHTFTADDFQNREKKAYEAAATYFDSFPSVHDSFVLYDAYEDGIDREGNRTYKETDTPLAICINTEVDIPGKVSKSTVNIANQFGLEVRTDTYEGQFTQIRLQPM